MKKNYSILTIVLILSVFSTKAQEFDWAVQMGSLTSEIAEAITVDPGDNVIITGSFSNNTDFDPGIGEYILDGEAFQAVFIQKTDSDGNLVWAKALQGEAETGFAVASGYGIKTDSEGNVFIVGTFQNRFDFDPSDAEFILDGNIDKKDAFILKLNADGDFLWANRIGGDGNDLGEDLTVDADGNVYLTGNFEGTVDFDSGVGTMEMTSVGDADGFVLKLASDGSFIWAKQLEGDGKSNILAVAVDEEKNVYITGFFFESADFDMGAGTHILTGLDNDIFVQKMDFNGDFIWATSMGGVDTDWGYDLEVDKNANVYVTGYFKYEVDFDAGDGEMIYTSAGVFDIFTLKLDELGDFLWAKQTGGDMVDSSFDMTLDNDNNIYITGSFGRDVDFDPGIGTYILDAGPSFNSFIQILNFNGDFIWAGHLAGDHINRSFGIDLDSENNLYIAGSFTQPVDFDPNVDAEFEMTPYGVKDIYILKLNTNDIDHSTIAENQLNNLISIYPNPTKGNFSISISNPNKTTAIYIQNVEGKLIQEIQSITDQLIDVQLDERTPNGLYFVTIISNNNAVTYKLVKH